MKIKVIIGRRMNLKVYLLCLVCVFYNCFGHVHASTAAITTLTTTTATASSTDDLHCVSPGTCSPPRSRYTRGRDVTPRYQWTSSGGFCGASSIQSLIQSFGAYFSQDLIRKKAPVAEGHGNRIEGYEILHTNIEPALQALGILYRAWDWEHEVQPQGVRYLTWMKTQLLENNGIVQFVICQGDAHQAYAETNPYDHIEPFFRLYTNHAVNDTTVYEDDVVAHGSGYSPDGDANLGYFRPLNTLLDDSEMKGNCAIAQEGWQKNEMYPCVYAEQTFGFALAGLKCGYNTLKPVTGVLPVTLFVNNTQEPNIRQGEEAVWLHGEVRVAELVAGARYVVYRWDEYSAFPATDGCNSDVEVLRDAYESSVFAYKHEFVATSGSYTLVDANPFISSGSTIYSCLADKSNK